MMAKLLFAGVGVIATVVVIWQASQAGWVRPPAAPAPAGTRPAIDGPSITRHRPDSVIAEGRLVTYPGAEIVVAVERSGLIVSLPVREKSVVRKGDLIVQLKSDELCASRDEAVARIDEAEADIRFYEREVERRRVLIARHAASDVELEINQRGLDVAQARRRAALAARRRTDALIAMTRITAPINGVVMARFAHSGETVDASARIVTLADLERIRVEAEVDEIDIGAIALGAEATIFGRIPGPDLARPG